MEKKKLFSDLAGDNKDFKYVIHKNGRPENEAFGKDAYKIKHNHFEYEDIRC